MQGTGGARAQRRPLIAAPRPLWIAGLVLSLGASQAAGWIIRLQMPPGTERVVLPHLLSLTVLHNSGMAFGMLRGFPPLAAVVVTLTVLAVVFYNRGAWSAAPSGQWGLGLILGGALGNVVERLRFGNVVDYLDLHVWPVFNLADAAIACGAGLLLLAMARSGGRR